MNKPRLVLSRCFLKPVRYDGGRVIDPFVERLKNYIEVIDICPEVGLGLSVPRERIIIVLEGDEKRLIQPDTGKDLTEEMLQFSEKTLQALPEVDGFILKAKSPSCGVGSTKLYKDNKFFKKTYGFFASAVKSTFPYLPLEDEGRLRDPEIRAHFLTRIFAFSELRNLSEKKDPKDLIEFHTRYKYLLLTYHQKILRELGRLVAKADLPLDAKVKAYKEKFYEAFSRKPSPKRNINTLLHLFGPLSKRLNKREREHFHRLLFKYEKGIISLKVVKELIKAMAYRFESEYLLMQKYLEPYPEELDL